MKRTLLPLLLLLLTACSDGSSLPTDDGRPAADAGDVSTRDAGPPGEDAGRQLGPDAGDARDLSTGPDLDAPDAAGDAGEPAGDLGPEDAGQTPDDGGQDPGPTEDAGGSLETCILRPAAAEGSCRHSFGGLYADRGCSGAWQCCAGAWQQGVASCGECSCTDLTGRAGCAPPDDAVEDCFEPFVGTTSPLPADVRALMTDSSWHEGCPVGLDELSLLQLSHWGFDGEVHVGEMVVATGHAEDLISVFRQIYEARFPLERMRLVDHYGASDDRSMADNNSSAFNCRPITGGGGWSQHSYGTAIDLNPVQNPYVSGGLVLPPEGAEYTDRGDVRRGMIVDPDPVTGAFRAIGWGWGGSWARPKDYQHFSANGL